MHCADGRDNRAMPPAPLPAARRALRMFSLVLALAALGSACAFAQSLPPRWTPRSPRRAAARRSEMMVVDPTP